jgi:aryl-alcohol dehydrogenase-like predicted oxidoreductase
MFSTMQNHYNLLYREDERELIPVCRQYGVSLIPYSPLAGGHLTHPGWTSGSVRSETDQVVKRRYDSSKENDLVIIGRVEEVAQRYQVTMSEVSLAWLYAKGVCAPIVGATKTKHFDDAVRASDLILQEDDIRYLEEAYKPHELKGPLPVK